MRGTTSRVRDGAACTHGRRVLAAARPCHRFLSRMSNGVVEVIEEQGRGGVVEMEASTVERRWRRCEGTRRSGWGIKGKPRRRRTCERPEEYLEAGGVAESRTAAGRPARERREPATIAGSPRGVEAMRGTTSRVRDGAACTHGRRVLAAARPCHRFLSRMSNGVVEVIEEQGRGGVVEMEASTVERRWRRCEGTRRSGWGIKGKPRRRAYMRTTRGISGSW
ncbi:hypothetical protein OsJ_28436 [Oryza sativa Japonica Group]|uniref:Uncharacterized protein n=1 Tax=Oryza sativa subsp. japonica TaxID=39947 RepID=B9G270_ORYSJ|nr:hypothetical protein OsJ_28436 [Oryza sativa Japonica Group]